MQKTVSARQTAAVQIHLYIHKQVSHFGILFETETQIPVRMQLVRTASHKQKVLKMLPSSSPGQHDGREAAAYKDILLSANAKAVPIIQVAVIEIDVPQER